MYIQQEIEPYGWDGTGWDVFLLGFGWHFSEYFFLISIHPSTVLSEYRVLVIIIYFLFVESYIGLQFLKEYFFKLLPFGYKTYKNIQSLYVCLRKSIVPKLHVRRAV